MDQAVAVFFSLYIAIIFLISAIAFPGLSPYKKKGESKQSQNNNFPFRIKLLVVIVKICSAVHKDVKADSLSEKQIVYFCLYESKLQTNNALKWITMSYLMKTYWCN